MVTKKKKFRSNSTSRKKILLLSIFIILLVYTVSILLISVFSISSPYRVEVVGYDFSVKDMVGINLDSDSLHFGGGPNGAILERALTINSDRPARVSINWEGDGDLAVNRNDFEIIASSNESVTFYLTIPENLSDGNYSGTVFLRFFEP